MNLFSVLTAKLFGGAAIVLALGLTVQTVRLAWTQTSLAKVVGELKWAREERRAFEVAIIDRTATIKAENKATIVRIESERNAATQEASNAYLQKRDAELALVRERVRARSQSDSGKACAGPDPSMPQGSMRPSPETELHDAEICTVNTLKLEGLIDAWHGAEAVPVSP